MINSAYARNAALTLSAFALIACGGETEASPNARGQPSVRTLTLGAYTTPREVYGQKILPAFARQWKEKTGEDVRFEESYLGSGAQSRAIIDGFEADVAALSLEPDIRKIADAKLITREWKKAPNGGMVSRSVVVIGVRPGNPKNIRGWDDLARKGVEVLTPNPKTSGGAMWNIVALYGAALRGGTRAIAGDSVAAEALLQGVIRNVRIMDKGARESMLTFESGVGDAIITYENEALVARKAGKEMDYVIPTSTILIENPAAVVDVYADKHGNRELAEAFVTYLATPEAQRHYSEYGLRAVDESVAKETAAIYPVIKELFTISDLGGWQSAIKTLFDRGGVFERATAKVVAAR